jgi:Catenin-beta-like, Arm-motif containing nuclear
MKVVNVTWVRDVDDIRDSGRLGTEVSDPFLLHSKMSSNCGSTNGHADDKSFVPAPTYQGSRPGYFFTTAEKGTGYYRDKTNGGRKRSRREMSNGNGEVLEEEDDRNANTNIASRPLSGAALLEQAERQLPADLPTIATRRDLENVFRQLPKWVAKNELQRAQYPDDARQYLDSELQLHQGLVALKGVAARRWYPDLVRLLMQHSSNETSVLEILVTQLLSHDNPDMVATTVSVWVEWLDPALLIKQEDEPDDLDDEAMYHQDILVPLAQLAAAFLNVTGCLELLVSNLARFEAAGNVKSSDVEDDDDDVGNGIDHILTLIENLLEMEQAVNTRINAEDSSASVRLLPTSLALKLVQETLLISWLAQLIKTEVDESRDLDSGRVGKCLDLLAALTPREEIYLHLPDWSRLPMYQSSFTDDSKKQKDSPAHLNAIEVLLQLVAPYRKQQPATDAAVEMVENTAIIMASLLTYSADNVQAFLDAQGIEFVTRCFKERVHAGGVMLKWLDFGSTTGTGPDRSDDVYHRACQHVVAAGTLKYLFPMLMGKHLPKLAPAAVTSGEKKAKKEWARNVTEAVIRVLYAMSHQLRPDLPQEAQARFVAKFAGDLDKCDRLVELCIDYDGRTREAEYRFYRTGDVEEAIESNDAIQNTDEAIDLAATVAKLSGGGDILHRVAALCAFCCVNSRSCHERIMQQLRMHPSVGGVGLLRSTLEEFLSVLDEASQARSQIQSYLDALY